MKGGKAELSECPTPRRCGAQFGTRYSAFFGRFLISDFILSRTSSQWSRGTSALIRADFSLLHSLFYFSKSRLVTRWRRLAPCQGFGLLSYAFSLRSLRIHRSSRGEPGTLGFHRSRLVRWGAVPCRAVPCRAASWRALCLWLLDGIVSLALAGTALTMLPGPGRAVIAGSTAAV